MLYSIIVTSSHFHLLNFIKIFKKRLNLSHSITIFTWIIDTCNKYDGFIFIFNVLASTSHAADPEPYEFDAMVRILKPGHLNNN